jgi:hypothetical protein
MLRARFNIKSLVAFLFLLFAAHPQAFAQPDSLKTTPQVRDTSAKNNAGQAGFKNKADSMQKRAQAFIPKKDSSERKGLLKKLIPSTRGTISAGYDYGIIPFAQNIKYPMGYYNSQGTVSFNALGLALNASYYYSSLTSVSGLNNYFRISFDQSAYKESLRFKGFKNLEDEKSRLTEYLGLQQILQQKLTYYELLKQGMPDKQLLEGKLAEYKSKYTQYQYNGNLPPLPSGSDTLNKPALPSHTMPDYADSIKIITSQINKYDSVANAVGQYKEKLESIQKQVRSINNKIAYLENPQKAIQDNPNLKKYEQLLSNIKKLDIGLCYPNYSTFLVNGSTLKGINLEWEKKLYFAFTYGKTINTLLTTNNIIQNQLQTGRNLYNFFDFNNVNDSRKLVSVKFGYGAKEATHLHLGVLYGVGLTSYLNTPVAGNREKNLVFEIDSRVVLNGQNSFDLVYGKSAVYQTGVTPDDVPGRSLFSNFRSNAALLRYTGAIQRTKTKIILTGRLIDPFFKSYGVGFLRSDNLRQEARIEQALGNKIKLSGFYRRDRDNLLNSFIYTTRLQTMGADLLVKVNRRLTARANYTPVVQQIAAKDSVPANNKNVNNISSLIVTYTPRTTGGVTSFFNGMYSYYQLSSVNGRKSSYQNINLTNTTVFNNYLKVNLTANYFSNNSGDSLNNNTFMAGGNASYNGLKYLGITMGVKYAGNTLIKNQLGGLVKINILLARAINLELQAEQLVLGDFYNSYNIKEIRQFPYYCYGKLIVSW